MNLISKIKNLFSPKYRIGDIWVTKPDGWEGLAENSAEWVIIAVNPIRKEVGLCPRKDAIYSNKHKVITKKSYDSLDMHTLHYTCKVVPYSELNQTLIRCPNNENFLEVDVLLDNQTI